MLTDQHRDRVLEYAALNLRIDLLRLAVEQLRLGADDIGFGRHAEFVATLGDLERELFGNDDVIQEALQLILGAQFKVVGGKLALGRQCRCRQRGDTGLRRCAVALDGAANLAPDIQCPVA